MLTFHTFTAKLLHYLWLTEEVPKLAQNAVCLPANWITGDCGSAATVTDPQGSKQHFPSPVSFIHSFSFFAGDLDGRWRWGQGRPSAVQAPFLWRSGSETSEVSQSRRAVTICCSCIYSTCHTKGDTQAPFIWCQQGERSAVAAVRAPAVLH